MYAILIITLITAINVRTIGPVRAAGNTPVYVLGVSSPTDPLITDLQNLTSSVTILASPTSLTLLTGGSILFIDGSWLATASSLNPTIIPTIVQSVFTGLPTVVVRGDPSILPNSITGLMKYQNPGLPLIAEGVHTTGTLSDGTVQGALLRVVSGFDYSISAEFQWASQQLPPPSAPLVLAPIGAAGHISRISTSALTPTGPFWQLTLSLSTDTGTQFAPYGRVITTLTLYQLENSGSTDFKWYNIFSNQTITPGTQAFHSNYRNYQESSFAQPNNQTSNVFVSHGPASQFSSGPFTVSYSIGTQAGVSNATVDASQGMSYSLKNTNVTDTSTTPNVSWLHTMTGGTSVGKLTLQVVPGWTDKIIQSAPLNIQGNLVVTFATFSGSSTPTATQSTGISFTVSGG